MKKDEIAMIMIEDLKLDENGMKLLDKTTYFYIQLIDWVTVIGLLIK